MMGISGLIVNSMFHCMFTLFFYSFIICLTNVKNQVFIYLIRIFSLHLNTVPFFFNHIIRLIFKTACDFQKT